jgi:hypothetical protein
MTRGGIREDVAAVRERSARATRREQGRLLTECCATTRRGDQRNGRGQRPCARGSPGARSRTHVGDCSSVTASVTAEAVLPPAAEVVPAPSGVTILTGHTGRPDAQGVLERFELRLPPFPAGSYWSLVPSLPGPGARVVQHREQRDPRGLPGRRTPTSPPARRGSEPAPPRRSSVASASRAPRRRSREIICPLSLAAYDRRRRARSVRAPRWCRVRRRGLPGSSLAVEVFLRGVTRR